MAEPSYAKLLAIEAKLVAISEQLDDIEAKLYWIVPPGRAANPELVKEFELKVGNDV